MLIPGAAQAVFHLPLIEHAAATVKDQLVRSQVLWELCAGGKLEVQLLPSILPDPAGNLFRPDIAALAVMGAALAD